MNRKLIFLYDYVFPTAILPNALINEFGIVNYLHSLYCSRPSTDSLFDNAGNMLSHNSTIFDNKLGSWPNSLGTNGTHLKHSAYNSYGISCDEQSLFIGRKNFRKYIYPIKINPHIDDFIGINLKPGNKLNGEYFWKHMSARALQDAQEGNALIFLDYGQENFIELNTYKNLHKVLEYSGIPKQQIVLAFNSFNAREVYESWFTPEERRLQVINWPFVMVASSHHYATCGPTQRLDISQFESTKDVIRPYHFLFKIRNTRPHRIALLYKMANEGLLEKSDWSCLTHIRFNQNEVDHLSEKYDFNLDADIIAMFCSLLPRSLSSEQGMSHSAVSAWTDKHATAHKNSYLYICTETFVHGEHKSLTEKVFKPIANFQPFLFVAYPGALALLQSLGFRTFAPFIDEAYDNEQDSVIRLQMIYKEIEKISKMSKEEIHDWYWSMKDILIHNHNHLLTVYKQETKSAELIEFLYNYVHNS
jgi:hypothetical protein